MNKRCRTCREVKLRSRFKLTRKGYRPNCDDCHEQLRAPKREAFNQWIAEEIRRYLPPEDSHA